MHVTTGGGYQCMWLLGEVVAVTKSMVAIVCILEPPTVLIHQYFYSNLSTKTDKKRQITENGVKSNVYHICVDKY